MTQKAQNKKTPKKEKDGRGHGPGQEQSGLRRSWVISIATACLIGAVSLGVLGVRHLETGRSAGNETGSDSTARTEENSYSGMAEESAVSSGNENREDGGTADGIANPFITCGTIEEAENMAGFDLTVPTVYDSDGIEKIRVIRNYMIEVIYTDGSGNEMFRIRKAKDSSDISGDYTVYDTDETLTESGTDVRLRGNNGSVSTLTWTDEDYSYAILAAENEAMTRSQMLALMKEIS